VHVLLELSHVAVHFVVLLSESSDELVVVSGLFLGEHLLLDLFLQFGFDLLHS